MRPTFFHRDWLCPSPSLPFIVTNETSTKAVSTRLNIHVRVWHLYSGYRLSRGKTSILPSHFFLVFRWMLFLNAGVCLCERRLCKHQRENMCVCSKISFCCRRGGVISDCSSRLPSIGTDWQQRDKIRVNATYWGSLIEKRWMRGMWFLAEGVNCTSNNKLELCAQLWIHWRQRLDEGYC